MAFYHTANDLRATLGGSLVGASSNYRETYNLIKAAMVSGLDYSQYTSDFNKYANVYASEIKKDAQADALLKPMFRDGWDLNNLK